MDRHEQGRARLTREAHPLRQRHKSVVGPRQQHAILACGLDFLLQPLAKTKHDVFFHLPGWPLSAGIDPAMSGIEDDQRPRIPRRLLLPRWWCLGAGEPLIESNLA